MALTKRKSEHSSLQLVPKFEGICDRIALKKSKILIGSSQNCDVVLESEGISSYHILLSAGEEGTFKVLDLDSKNGVFINGQRIKDSLLAAGDSLTIGKAEFYLEELLVEAPIEDSEQTVELLESGVDFIPFHELPPMPGVTLVDGEACYLDCQDESFQPGILHPLWEGAKDYEEPIYDVGPESLQSILKEKTGLSLEVCLFSKNSILAVEYLPLRETTYKFSGGRSNATTVYLDTLGELETHSFLEYKNGHCTIMPLAEYQLSRFDSDGKFKQKSEKSFVLAEGEMVRYSTGGVQVFVRLTDTPPGLKKAPFFEFDKEMNKQAGKVLGVGLALMLLLLLVPEHKKREISKKLAVIYKLKHKNPTTEDVATVKQDNPKNESQEKVKTEKAQTGQPQKAPKVGQAKPKKAPAPKAPTQQPVKKITKVDTYKNPFKSSMQNLLAKSGSANNVKVQEVNTDSSAIAETAVKMDAGGSLKQSQFKDKIGDIGRDPGIKKVSSLGAKGLVDKKGIVSTLMPTKTVVLGAIDPELLRKILEEYLPQFRHCYQKELEFNSHKIKGVVDLMFTIDKNGHAKRIKVIAKKAAFSKNGTDCMAKVLSIIEFPKPKGGGIVDVRQPLNFYSENG